VINFIRRQTQRGEQGQKGVCGQVREAGVKEAGGASGCLQTTHPRGWVIIIIIIIRAAPLGSKSTFTHGKKFTGLLKKSRGEDGKGVR